MPYVFSLVSEEQSLWPPLTPPHSGSKVPAGVYGFYRAHGQQLVSSAQIYSGHMIVGRSLGIRFYSF